MNELFVQSNQMQMEVLKKDIRDISNLPSLQRRLDEAEKYGQRRFDNFTDPEMIQWYLYERRHLNQENDRSKRTIQEYERELLLFIEQLLAYSTEIDVDIDTNMVEVSLFKSLQSRHLRRYQEWLATSSPYALRNGGYSAATLERKTTIIKSFFSFLHEVGYIKEPIHNGFRIATVRKDDRPNRDLGPGDVVALLDTFKENGHVVMFTIIHVLTTTGIRNEEFCNLTVGDLKVDSLHGGYYLDVLGKGNKRRHIPLRDKVVKSIRKFRAARGLLPFEEEEVAAALFTTNSGRAYSPSYLAQYVSKQIRSQEDLKLKLSDRTLNLTPHIFRHAFAIISNLNGSDIYQIMRSLGHEKIETTMIYLEKVFARERHAIHSWKADSFGEYI